VFHSRSGKSGIVMWVHISDCEQLEDTTESVSGGIRPRDSSAHHHERAPRSNSE
jgi:hypothetical protein